MTRRPTWIPLVALLAACSSPGTDPAFAVFPTEAQGVTLPAVGWKDADTTFSSVSVLNQGWFPFDVREIKVTGANATFLELQAPGDAGGVTLGVRDSAAIRLRVRPPDVSTRATWSSDTLTAELEFQIFGTGKIDPETQQPDTASIKAIATSIPITFTLDCDLDGDGYDAEACSGGTDCDDALIAIRPDAREDCDGADNDCDHQTDENCTPI